MDKLQEVLIGFAIAVIPVLGLYTVAYLKQKTAEIQNRVNNDTINKYILMASDAIQSSVTSVFQTYVDTLKKNGKFDETAQKEAFNLAKEKSMSILSDTVKNAIKEVYGDLDQFVNIMIEKYISDQKVK